MPVSPNHGHGKIHFIHFSAECLPFVSWNLPHCVPPGSSERDWPVRPNHSIVLPLSPSLLLSLSLSVRYFITGWHTDPNIDVDFFFFLITSGSRRMSQGLLINCHNNCTKSSFWKWTIALFKWSMWQSEIYPTHFTALGIQHCHQDVRIIVLIPFFISFCPTSKISDHASMSAQRHIRLQLNANVGVLIKATQHLPTSPY